jgi:hypothetical protein
MRYSLSQGSADVSPFSPFLFHPASVFSRGSLLLTTHRPLPTFPRPLFSYSYKSLLPQPLYFHIHTKPRGCGRISTPYLATRHSPLATRLPRALSAKGHFPRIFSSLPPLCFSCLSFSHSLPLFSSTCSLFSQNAGGTSAQPFTSDSVCVLRASACPDLVGVAIQSGCICGGTCSPQVRLESPLVKVCENK